MRSLYAITEEIAAMEQALEDAGGCVDDPKVLALMDRMFEVLDGDELDKKVDNYVWFIMQMSADVDARVELAKGLKDATDAEKRTVQRMKDHLHARLDRIGRRKAGKVHKVSIRKAGGKQAVVLDCEPEELPEQYREIVTTVKPKNDELREALERGEEIPGATLRPRGEYIKLPN